MAEDGGNFDDFIDRKIAYRIDGPAWVNNHAHILKAKPGVCQSFVYWSLAHKDIRRFIAGGTRAKLTQGELRQIEINLPVESERQIIARILDTLDTAIQQTEAILEKLKSVKQGLLHDLLTRGIDANGQLRPPQSEAPHLYKESPLGWIPKEWESRQLGELSSIIIDGTHFTPRYTESGVPFLRVTDVQVDNIDPQSVKFISPAEHSLLVKRCKPQFGDVLLSKNGTVGIAKLVDWNWEFSVFVSLALIRLNNSLPISNKFIVGVLNSQVIKTQIHKRSKQGTVTNLHLEEIREFEVPFPSLPEQNRILGVAASHDSKMRLEQSSLEKLLHQKIALMDDLLTGRVRVTPLLENAA